MAIRADMAKEAEVYEQPAERQPTFMERLNKAWEDVRGAREDLSRKRRAVVDAEVQLENLETEFGKLAVPQTAKVNEKFNVWVNAGIGEGVLIMICRNDDDSYFITEYDNE